ncbi:MAG: hypothetical protein ACXADY_02880 [Candidatus Hodarchaeales archaeon]|jgi:hypothetical protein
MSDDLTINLISGTFGAIIALLIREIFSWKGQGRLEAIEKYDRLITECYGVLIHLLKDIGIYPERIWLKSVTYNALTLIHSRFSHRIREEINDKIEKILFESETRFGDDFESIEGYLLNFHNDEERNFMDNLINDVQMEKKGLIDKIDELESFVRSIKMRIKYLFLVWSF